MKMADLFASHVNSSTSSTMSNKRLCFNSRADDDRISELPDDILHKILCYLSTKEAARTSILCKSCLQAWQSYPDLDFDQSYFCKELPQHPSCCLRVTGNPEAEKALKKFVEFVDRSIEKFSMKKLQLKRLRLFISLIDPELYRFVDKWIGLAFSNLVEELDLSFGNMEIYKLALPHSALSLKALSLCNGKLAIGLSRRINLNSLKKLHLKNVTIDNQTMHRLFTGCPYTEDLLLLIVHCRRIVDLSVLKYLKNVDVKSEGKSGKLLIEASGLEKLQCSNIKSLVLSPISSHSSLRVLYLRFVDITDQCLHNLMANSPQIESLKLSCCSNLERLRISSSSLLKFEIGCSWRKLVEIDIHALNLRNFSYDGELPPSSVFRHTSPLCLASITLHRYLSVPKWIQFLSDPVQLMRLRLNVSQPPKGNVLNGLVENSLPTTWKVEHLELVAHQERSQYNHLAELLVRSCKPKTLTIVDN